MSGNVLLADKMLVIGRFLRQSRNYLSKKYEIMISSPHHIIFMSRTKGKIIKRKASEYDLGKTQLHIAD